MNSTPTLLSGMKRRLWIVGLFGIAGAVLAAIPQPSKVEDQATTFEATHTMLINDTTGLSSSTGVPPDQVVLLATNGDVPQQVADEIGFKGNPAALADQISVTFDQATGALLFTTSQSSAARGGADRRHVRRGHQCLSDRPSGTRLQQATPDVAGSALGIRAGTRRPDRGARGRPDESRPRPSVTPSRGSTAWRSNKTCHSAIPRASCHSPRCSAQS